MEGLKLDSRFLAKERRHVVEKVSHFVQYDLNKVQTICLFCSKWWQSRLNAPLTYCLFLLFFYVLEVCILTIMIINQLELIGSHLASGLCGSQPGGPAAPAPSGTRLLCARVGVARGPGPSGCRALGRRRAH